jgi:oligopeptide/dipeptide ABC transporter ATP-binding protein
MSDLLEIEHLRIALPIDGELQPVVADVSLTLKAGEALGLVGESGSGKSMTARAILRLLPRSAEVSGNVLFDGESVQQMSRRRLLGFRSADVGIVFQDPRAHVNPVRRIGDFLCEALVTSGQADRRHAEVTVRNLLARVGIQDGERRMRQYPHELSGGLLQRVMIASALSTNPRLLVADEPTTALDVTTQAEVVGLLNELRSERSLGLIFITHDLNLAAAICDRTAVMYAGAVVEVQPSRRLHEHPLHPYTAALALSRPSIDRTAVRLQAIGGQPAAAYEAPSGCSFAPRCPHAEDACRAAEPDLRRLTDDGVVACRRAEELKLTTEGRERVSG